LANIRNGALERVSRFSFKQLVCRSEEVHHLADVVEKLVSVEKVGPVEKTDVHNRAIFDNLTSRNVATYLEKIRCRVFQHNRPHAEVG